MQRIISDVSAATSPAPDSPAGVGCAVDTDALQPAVERGPIDPRDPPWAPGVDATPPIAADEGQAAAELIAKPMRYVVAISATEGEPVVVAPESN